MPKYNKWKTNLQSQQSWLLKGRDHFLIPVSLQRKSSYP